MTRVRVAEGILEGEKLHNDYGGSFYSFKGIPYAEPPLRELRFKAPIPKQPWTGVRLAKEHGPRCYQIDLFFQPASNMEPSGSEDCLYLNVYSPDIAPSKPLPVMVYIHGGAFMSGSGNDDIYGPEFLVKHDVILVTINYRLEVIGFLCLDTEDIPGNAGMKDQVAALRWVKNNIESFGGDPNNITIFGESAGAASVSYQLVSPMSKGLFQRAIMQSGTLLSPWAYSSVSARQIAFLLAKHMGCDSTDDKVIYEFFKTQPIENLIMKRFPLTYAQNAKNWVSVMFSVVAEKEFPNIEAFFTGDVVEVLRQGIHEGVDVINGCTADEGTVGFVSGLTAETVYEQASKFNELLIPQPLTYHCSTLQQLEIGKKVKEFYLKDASTLEEVVQKVVRFMGTDYFKYYASLWQKICAKNNKNRIYYYKFTCHSQRNIFSNRFNAGKFLPNTSVSHCDDLAYIFPCKSLLPKVEPNSKAYKMIDSVTQLWSNFAKYGNPTPDNNLKAIWEPFTIDKQYYMDIGEKLQLNSELDKEEITFWETIFSEYFPRLVP
ncbi:juvenile hormone esterase-like [Pieris brassicae]|uniref:juvenile hormone esterase-like n=1 Tax=Pieris brassicae TaxID=7116 RepID=UPI001E662522|nr:juvenile hormone esterase-like [Pieris brassicae]XP_045523636.1 juvenile hormone esterase-like [Pieris brassicae]XP_045523637.1 juvenile hormone esterase-like [Pieris brassicae]XP_045523638.1 juvenile hormone esterase-like [Pieris brassicae]